MPVLKADVQHKDGVVSFSLDSSHWKQLLNHECQLALHVEAVYFYLKLTIVCCRREEKN